MAETETKPAQLVNAADFDRALFRYIAQNKCTQIEAFKTLNEIYFNEFNRLRYASFNSYVINRSRRIKQNR